MKGLSVRQPWAWAILHAGKNVENRSQRFRYRGPLLVRASTHKVLDLTSWPWPEGAAQPSSRDLVRGAVLGLVELVDVVDRSSSPWFKGAYGLILENPRVLSRPIPFKGSLGIWTAPPELVAQVTEQLGLHASR